MEKSTEDRPLLPMSNYSGRFSNTSSPSKPSITTRAHFFVSRWASSIPRIYHRPRIIAATLFALVVVGLLVSSSGVTSTTQPVELGESTNSSTTVETAPDGKPLVPEVLPPLYPDHYAYEASLIQHHTSPPAGTNKKFIYFNNHVLLLGFNNHLEEYLMSGHLAYLTNRSLVFHEYTWGTDADNEPYSEWYGRKIPSRIPESVLLGGWLGGTVRQSVQDHEDWDRTPVSRPYFESVCPAEERVYVHVNNVMDSPMETVVDVQKYPHLAGKRVRDGDGLQLVQAWVGRLLQDDIRDARCVEFSKSTGQAFDFWLFGAQTLHSIWPSLVHSPVLQHWSFSPLIYEAFRRNVVDRELLGNTAKTLVALESNGLSSQMHVASVIDDIEYDAYGYPSYPGGRPQLPMHTPASTRSADSQLIDVGVEQPFEQRHMDVLPFPRAPQPSPNSTIEGDGTLPILVLHLRRGDFEEHCRNLGGWGSSFMGFVTFPEFEERDMFRPPRVVDPPPPPPPAAPEESHDEKQEEHGSKDEDEREQEQEDDFRRRAVDDDAKDIAATRGTVKVVESTSGEVTSRSSFVGHVYRDPKVATSAERGAMYSKHCYPTNQQIVHRVRDVVEDWVLRRFVVFVEKFETGVLSRKSHSDEENEAEYRQALNAWKMQTMSKLKSVYLMTNGDKVWTAGVREALRGLSKSSGDGQDLTLGLAKWQFNCTVEVETQRAGHGDSTTSNRTLEWTVDEWPWDAYKGETSVIPLGIASARDLELTPEEKYVSQAVDMYIGQRAEVFIGNGFSSLTANVVMLRKNAGLDPLQTRFW